MDGQVLEELKVFKYLGLLMMVVRGVGTEVKQLVLEGSKVM